MMTKGALRSKTIRAGWMTTALSLTSILTMLSENAEAIQTFFMGVIPTPFDMLVGPIMAVLVAVAHLYLGKNIVDGRDEAATTAVRIKGLFKGPS